MTFWPKMLKRAFDREPIACHLYVTDQCNLDCHYCTEYDNSVPHPSLKDLKRWIRKIKDLGCIRVGLQGGEPLLHPDIVEVVRYCKDLRLRTSLSTNGFKLTPELIQALEEAGLDALQVSVDRMTPVPSTRKALKTLIPKLEHLRRSRIPYHISGVLFSETLAESRQVLEYGFSKGISTHARLVHAGPDGGMRVGAGEKAALASFVDSMIEAKRGGKRVHTTGPILDYQKALLNGGGVDWTCVAGYKYFFVSAKGEFWLCSTNRRPALDIMSVTPDLLRSYFHKKACQAGCGVYCIVETSMFCNHPVRFLLHEGRDRLRQGMARLWAGKAASRSLTQVEGDSSGPG
ncbi:MAG: hypothetical protein A3F84_17590 [Candidatus Handelsmanbacteria bacterium RIFCSPLOWO2_12_FULL_64_10]|uniref:Radical SAM core domain-containing protein n=1 Tax=Handelsmanbacteria sp. (strain RIFCSPLOWO2_12_FULL_64_10) TaxID=1817868 RepID=A0A1F6CY26_HANXR|nr:MAG: hypothetical protein A3F84_17590 [Candidatus Handelsmanbacteria bacterium RIFCSPLOWO2_12_FULL_64_10]